MIVITFGPKLHVMAGNGNSRGTSNAVICACRRIGLVAKRLLGMRMAEGHGCQLLGHEGEGAVARFLLFGRRLLKQPVAAAMRGFLLTTIRISFSLCKIKAEV